MARSTAISFLRAALLAAALTLPATGHVHAQQADAREEDLTALAERILALRTSGNLAEATGLAERLIALSEARHGPRHPALAIALNHLALLHMMQGRHGEALALLERSVAIRQASLGPDHDEVGTALFSIASVHLQLGRLDEAERLLIRVLAIKEKAHGAAHVQVIATVNSLAVLYLHQGRYVEAEPRLKRVIAGLEQVLGAAHSDVGTAVSNLATCYRLQGRAAEAEPFYRRAVAIKEAAHGADHTDVGTAVFGLGTVLFDQSRYAEAEPLLQRALAIKERALGPDHSEVATALNSLAVLYTDVRRFAEAEPLYGRVIAIKRKALGAGHADVGIALHNLARLHLAKGSLAEAERLLREALAIVDKALGSEHPGVRDVLADLGQVHMRLGSWAAAKADLERATAISIRRSVRGNAGPARDRAGKGDDAVRTAELFSSLVRVGWRLAGDPHGGAAADDLARASFVTAQWGQESAAAQALAQMAARGASGSAALAALVRARQDLVAEWQRLDGLRDAALARPEAERDKAAEATDTARLAAVDARIAEIDGRLASEFPEFHALSRPQPLSVEAVQAVLRPDEALLLFLDTARIDPLAEETFVWLVMRSSVRLVRSTVGSAGLAREVAALRCGLDASAWRQDGAQACGARLGWPAGAAPPEPGQLPFDVARASALHRALLGEIEDLIRGKHLLVVASGALSALPFQVLVTSPVAAADPQSAAARAKAAWLGLRQPISVLPSVASIRALREHARVSRATTPYIGFANPLLLGADGRDRRAFARQQCRQQVAAASTKVVRAGVRQPPGKLVRGGLGDVGLLRHQPPLPETADEVCAVARALGVADPDSVAYLGRRATERAVRAASKSGALARARIVHFATHGLVAGETARLAADLAEPALLLTPPDTATAEDDGLLSASEVAGLVLDADWVILSACNTAAGEGIGGDALSGLARAFFYAGARALLVSHWYVESDAAVALVTRAFGALQSDPRIGRAEAMRRAMSSLVAAQGTTAHPASWAPFTVVGEGAPVSPPARR